jgi:hypothetical protein
VVDERLCWGEMGELWLRAGKIVCNGGVYGMSFEGDVECGGL